MTIADLRDIIADLPNTMPIAVPGYELGMNPVTHAAVESLAPRRKIYSYEGVLGGEEDGLISARSFLCLWTHNQQGDVDGRLREAGIDATYNADKCRWYSTGWSEDAMQLRIPFDGVAS